MKYSFVIPYYDRPTLWNTLLSFYHYYRDRTDYEVIILEDRKNAENPQQHLTLSKILKAYPQLPIVYRRMNYVNWSCPCSAINDGVDLAQGEYVIMTNPECMHRANVLLGFDEELFRNERNIYVVCGCVSVQGYPENALDFEQYRYTERQWYQHTVHAPRNLNFCTVISKADYVRIGGFNEEYDKGLGRADVDFIHRVSQANMRIVNRDDLLVLHQDHIDSYPAERKQELININYGVNKFTSRFLL